MRISGWEEGRRRGDAVGRRQPRYFVQDQRHLAAALRGAGGGGCAERPGPGRRGRARWEPGAGVSKEEHGGHLSEEGAGEEGGRVEGGGEDVQGAREGCEKEQEKQRGGRLRVRGGAGRRWLGIK